MLDKLSKKDKTVLIVGSFLIVSILTYNFVQLPLEEDNSELALTIEQKQKDLQWMKTIEPKIKKLRIQNRQKRSNQQSLLSLIDTTAKQHKIDNRLQRIEPMKTGDTKVWIENVEFDRLSKWLQAISNRNIRIKEISVRRVLEKSGIVDCAITLT